jgi:hypothetical protein
MLTSVACKIGRRFLCILKHGDKVKQLDTRHLSNQLKQDLGFMDFNPETRADHDFEEKVAVSYWLTLMMAAL